ncbi:hypothetical protein B7486_10930 [cyanobacterium TDX16]|nr:hypothetical protein B7486_10930 [cyanobacterium TDX16]
MKSKLIALLLLTIHVSGCQSQEHVTRVEGQNSPQGSPQLTPVQPDATNEKYAAEWNGHIQIDVEEKLSQWTPQPHDREVPAAAIRDPRIEVEGHWLIDSSYDHSTMQLSLLPSKHYSVEIHSRGCGIDWELRRTAVFHDGVLLFDRPAEVAGLGSFDRLFAVRLDSRPCLLPPRHAACLNNELDASGEITANSGIIERCTFGRSGERLTYADRYEFHAAP